MAWPQSISQQQEQAGPQRLTGLGGHQSANGLVLLATIQMSLFTKFSFVSLFGAAKKVCLLLCFHLNFIFHIAAMNNLKGTIPEEVSTLSDMLRIDFFGNELTSSLPKGLGNVTKLELLDLEENMLTGSIFTAEVLSLTSLVGLRGSFNNFTGSIPPEIRGLTNLEQLWLAENKLGGSLPIELGLLTKMESLFLYKDELTGPIPTQMGAMANLTQVRIYDNTLNGKIPAELFNLTKLESIRFDSNALTGAIPTTIGNLVVLEDLRLNNNEISGLLPSEIGNLFLLKNLILNDMVLSGSIPSSFENLFSLDFLDMSNNAAIFGTVPTEIFSLPDIRIVYLSNCSLFGPMPSNYASPPKLRDLYLDGNLLNGTVGDVPAGSLLNLNELLIQGNNLSGSVPASLCALRNNATGTLDDLWSDCGGAAAKITCSFPDCCNRCFDNII